MTQYNFSMLDGAPSSSSSSNNNQLNFKSLDPTGNEQSDNWVTAKGEGVQVGSANFKGNLVGNAWENLGEMSAGISSLARGIFVKDSEERRAMAQTWQVIKDDPKQAKMFADAILSTYNTSLDDFGTKPLGEIVGNVVSGAWSHPIDTFLDVMTLGELTGAKAALRGITKNSANLKRVEIAANVTRDNLRTQKIGQDLIKATESVYSKFKVDDIAKTVEAMETIGLRNMPKELRPIAAELTRLNDTYKAFVGSHGAKLIDDAEFAAMNLMTREAGLTFAEAEKVALKGTESFKDTLKYVKENDVRPFMHINPKIDYDAFQNLIDNPVETSIFKRAYGGKIDYNDMVTNAVEKTVDFVSKVTTDKVAKTIENINKQIKAYNKANPGNIIKELPKVSTGIGRNVLAELNSELKKVMLSGGIYLGANAITTTLTILNNFNFKAAAKTFKELPKWRLRKVAEATTPGLKSLSRANNIFYRPVASTDRWFEEIGINYIRNKAGVEGAEYLKKLGHKVSDNMSADDFAEIYNKLSDAEKAKYDKYLDDNFAKMQSMVPTYGTTTNQLEAAVKSIIPFGSYPVAAFKEILAKLRLQPKKMLIGNQLNKMGRLQNEELQQQEFGEVKDITKVLHTDDQEQIHNISTIVTPIQAMNMFMFGTNGDAVQIPILNFLNKLISGSGDSDVFEIDGESYRVENGMIETQNGKMSLIPALKYSARNLLSPVQVYNQVVAPLLTDKYVKKENTILNNAVNDSQYSNLSSNAQRKVVTNTRARLAKKVVGTYDYNYYDKNAYISKSTKRKIIRRLNTRKELEHNIPSRF